MQIWKKTRQGKTDVLYRRVTQLTNTKRKKQNLLICAKECNVLTDSDKLQERMGPKTEPCSILECNAAVTSVLNHDRRTVSGHLLLLLACAKSHMLSASRRQPHLLHVSAVDCRQTWSMDKS